MIKRLSIPLLFLVVSLISIQATSTKVTLQTCSIEHQKKVSSLTRTDIEKQIGRKLNFKERIAWVIAKKQMKELIYSEPTKETNQNAIIGLFLAYLIPPIGLVFCLIALSQIKKNPEKYSGKGLAIAGIVIVVVEIVALIVLAVILSSLTFPACTCNWFYIH